MVVAGSLDGTPPYKDRGPNDYLESAGFVFGYMASGSQLPELLSGAVTVKAKSRKELPDCIPLEKKGELGTFTAWLDPRNGFLPRRLELRKSRSDKLGRQGPTVGEFTVPPGKIYPTAKLISTFLVIDSMDIGDFGGIPVIRAYSSTDTYSYADGQSLKFHTTFSMGDLRKPEEKDFSPTIPIPDGTPVNMQTAPQIRHVWHQGRIEVDSTPDALRVYEGVKHLHGHGPWYAQGRYLFVAANVAIAVLLFAIWIVRRSRSSS
jgi:hypothetical protein